MWARKPLAVAAGTFRPELLKDSRKKVTALALSDGRGKGLEVLIHILKPTGPCRFFRSFSPIAFFLLRY